jgi:sugar phosphate permease
VRWRGDGPGAAIPRTVWTLGFVSLFMDMSSEAVHSVLPIFLTATLGANVAILGLIDGVAEATAALSKVFSGSWSDRLDTVGAVLGPLLAVGVMAMAAGNVRAVFFVAVIPAALAVALIVVGVEDRAGARPSPAGAGVRLGEARAIGRAFWVVVAVGIALTLARFSESFLVLKAAGQGLAPALAPLALVVMSLTYALGAYPAGVLADRRPAAILLLAGLAALLAADLALAFAPGLAGAFAGIALWGVHLALTQGLLSKMVAAAAPARLRGTAFGIFNFATGLALLFASLIAGLLWDRVGPDAPFLAGALFAAIAAAILIFEAAGGRRRGGDRI